MKTNLKNNISTSFANINIGNKMRRVALLNISSEIDDENINVNKLHHIQILDRSYSMCNNMASLVNDVKKTIDALPNGDLFSVIWFSGDGDDECKVLIKGAVKGDDMETYHKLLDSISSCIGCTCFSHPIESMTNVIDDLKDICPFFTVTLFTDGESCCNIINDEAKALLIVKDYKNKDCILSLNTIGYGNYYDKEFLTKLAESSSYGKFTHSSDIKDYSKIYSHNFESIQSLVGIPLDIKAEGAESILYLNLKTSKFVNNSSIHISAMDRRKNQIAIIYPENDFNDNSEIEVSFNNETIKIKYEDYGLSVLNSRTVLNILYTLAYEYYYMNNRAESLDILNYNLHDKPLIDSHIKSFSRDEIQNHLKKLNDSAFGRGKLRKRTTNTAPDDYVPKKDAFCVLDLLKILADDENAKFIPDLGNYNRIGLKVTDTFNLFESNKDTSALETNFSNLVFNKSNLNVSIRCIIPGIVKINPKQATKVDLPTSIDSKIYRTYTIIKDGNLNMDYIKAVISKNTYDVIKSQENNLLDILSERENDYVEVGIKLTEIPIINQMYQYQANDIDDLGKLVYNELKYGIFQKVLNYRLKNYENDHKEIAYSAEARKYTSEQLNVLAEHGLNNRLEYVGVNNEIADKNEKDYYMTRTLEFQIKGCSSIPSIESTMKNYNSDGKNNLVKRLIAKYYNEYGEITNDDEYENYKESLNICKKGLMDNRIDLNIVKMSKILTGSWWKFTERDSKGNEIFETTIDNNEKINIIVKSGYEKKYF